MLKFELARLILIGDIERCPYHPFSNEAKEWHKNQENEEMLRALERYLVISDYLRDTYQYLKD